MIPAASGNPKADLLNVLSVGDSHAESLFLLIARTEKVINGTYKTH